MIKTARQLKDLIRNLSRKSAADAQILMRNYNTQNCKEKYTKLQRKLLYRLAPLSVI